VVAIALTALLGAVLAAPPWYTFDANVRLCADYAPPDADCSLPDEDPVATVIFGPGSAGHTTSATVEVNGEVVDTADAVVTTADGRLLSMPIEWSTACEEADCAFRVTAVVDEEPVFSRTIRRHVQLIVEGGVLGQP
jgi:hypothetical protein